jgi:hypothetical protein
MLAKGRMGFAIHRIRGVKGLNAILERAAELETQR